MSSQGKFLSEGLHGEDGGPLDMAELPTEYLVKGFLRNACNDGHETLTRVLLDKGADVNYITSNSQLPTALHVAVSSTRESILPIILPLASNATIQAALQFAIQYQTRLANIINILQKDGASISNNGDTKDKDKDKSPIEKAAKETPQKSLQESETQTMPPSRHESETQTNGDSNGQQRSDERSERKEAVHAEKVERAQDKDTGAQIQQLQEQQIQQQLLHQQFQEHQKQLQEQQQLLQEQLVLNEKAQKKADSAQQAAAQAQQHMEELKTQLQTQDEQFEIQKGQVQKLTAQLTSQEELTQKLTAQLTVQESQTQKLTDQLADQNGLVQKLSDEVRAGEEQISQLKSRIVELEAEKAEMKVNFDTYAAKSDAAAQDFQAQIAALQKDIEVKTRKIENISTERDSERRAKEVVKHILTSNSKMGSPENPETLGHSYAIRMGSVRTPSPLPQDDDECARPPPPPSPSLKTTTKLRTSSNGIAPRSDEKKAEKDPSYKRSKTSNELSAPLVKPGKSLSSKSRSKDDMDIASEADRARVRRLVERWEEMKYLELTTKQ